MEANVVSIDENDLDLIRCWSNVAPAGAVAADVVGHGRSWLRFRI
jgi:hypothetical protein